jgi:hypothetical protein
MGVLVIYISGRKLRIVTDDTTGVRYFLWAGARLHFLSPFCWFLRKVKILKWRKKEVGVLRTYMKIGREDKKIDGNREKEGWHGKTMLLHNAGSEKHT